MYHNYGFLTIEACLAIALLASMSLIIAHFQARVYELHQQTVYYIQIVDHGRMHLSGQKVSQNVCCQTDCTLFIETIPVFLDQLPLERPFPLSCLQIHKASESNKHEYLLVSMS